jgi:hypothetical protein
VLGLVVALLALTPAAPAVSATDDDVVWSVQPSTPDGPDGRTAFDFRTAPGTTISDWIAVTNQSEAEATFRVYAADATTDYDTSAFTLIGARQASTDLGAWTSIDGAASACDDSDDEAEAACAAGLGIELTLGPGQRADIPFTIAVPHEATPGDHAAGIVASHVTQATGEGGAAVSRENRVGARVYVRVDGALSPGLAVSGAVTDYEGGWNPFAGGTAVVGFDLINGGNVRLDAAPTVSLTGPFGIDLGTVELPAVDDLVPGGRGHVQAELPGVPPLLLLFADISVAPLPASAAAADDPLPAPVASSAMAWAMPWTLLLGVALAAAAVWLVLWRRRRRRDRLAEEIAAYAERIRAEERGARGAEPVPSGAGHVPRDPADEPR